MLELLPQVARVVVSLIGFVGIVFGRKLLIGDIFVIVLVIAAFHLALGNSGILRYYLTIR